MACICSNNILHRWAFGCVHRPPRMKVAEKCREHRHGKDSPLVITSLERITHCAWFERSDSKLLASVAMIPERPMSIANRPMRVFLFSISPLSLLAFSTLITRFRSPQRLMTSEASRLWPSRVGGISQSPIHAVR